MLINFVDHFANIRRKRTHTNVQNKTKSDRIINANELWQ